jgi:hypothetical protein
MRPRTALAALLAAFACVARADAPSVNGLWIHHGKWQFAHDEFNERGNIHKNADAAVMNFCPNGVFRLATGVIYQSTRSPRVVIGASDGLAIYSGKWWKDGDTVRVEYRLFSAEFELHRPGEREARPLLNGSPSFVGRRLQFVLTTRQGSTWKMEFQRASDYEKLVENDFVECSVKPH